MNIHKPIFTADDISDFLVLQGCPRWNKKIFCGCGFDTREVLSDDLDSEEPLHLYF